MKNILNLLVIWFFGLSAAHADLTLSYVLKDDEIVIILTNLALRPQIVEFETPLQIKLSFKHGDRKMIGSFRDAEVVGNKIKRRIFSKKTNQITLASFESVEVAKINRFTLFLKDESKSKQIVLFQINMFKQATARLIEWSLDADEQIEIKICDK